MRKFVLAILLLVCMALPVRAGCNPGQVYLYYSQWNYYNFLLARQQAMYQAQINQQYLYQRWLLYGY